jgi:hypothetical protein
MKHAFKDTVIGSKLLKWATILPLLGSLACSLSSPAPSIHALDMGKAPITKVDNGQDVEEEDIPTQLDVPKPKDIPKPKDVPKVEVEDVEEELDITEVDEDINIPNDFGFDSPIDLPTMDEGSDVADITDEDIHEEDSQGCIVTEQPLITKILLKVGESNKEVFIDNCTTTTLLSFDIINRSAMVTISDDNSIIHLKIWKDLEAIFFWHERQHSLRITEYGSDTTINITAYLWNE